VLVSGIMIARARENSCAQLLTLALNVKADEPI
jgi:hypothetical protein